MWVEGGRAQDTVEEEHSQLGRAEGDVDRGGRQKDGPVLDEDATQLRLDLILGEGQALALHDREEVEDDDREDRPATPRTPGLSR